MNASDCDGIFKQLGSTEKGRELLRHMQMTLGGKEAQCRWLNGRSRYSGGKTVKEVLQEENGTEKLDRALSAMDHGFNV